VGRAVLDVRMNTDRAGVSELMIILRDGAGDLDAAVLTVARSAADAPLRLGTAAVSIRKSGRLAGVEAALARGARGDSSGCASRKRRAVHDEGERGGRQDVLQCPATVPAVHDGLRVPTTACRTRCMRFASACRNPDERPMLKPQPALPCGRCHNKPYRCQRHKFVCVKSARK